MLLKTNASASIMRPLCVPLSHLAAVERYPGREVPLNYSESRLFYGDEQDSFRLRNGAKMVAVRVDM